MSDVFISYARSMVREAVAIEAELRALGYSVWRDDQLPTHRVYADVLEERVNAAKAVVVIWSADALKSDWVRAEADAARQAAKLVQLSLDGVAPPMPFNQIHCAEMKGWSGDVRAPAWRKVVESVIELVGAATRSTSPASPSPGRSAADGPLLAVLAFDNISGDEELLYFTDGVSEEILQTVARTTQLKVIGRGSSFQFRGADKAAAKVAQALNATHVLDGSVRRSGQRVRIAANLIECAGETTLWSDRFDRELSDIFVLQDEIAASVAAALEVVFARTRTADPINPSAHDLYLRASSLITGHIASEPMTDAVISLLEEATRLEPRFAMAWAALAGMRVAELRTGVAGEPYAAARDKVVAAAEAALSADPSLGMAYLPLASLEPFGRYAAREVLIDKALAAAPHDLHVLTTTAFFSAEVGRIQEAADRAKQAFDLDPMQFQASYAYATFMDAAGRYTETKALWDAFCDRWPDSEMMIDASMAAAMQNADWDRFANLAGSPTTAPDPNGRRRAMAWYARNLRTPDAGAIGRLLERASQEQLKAGSIRLDRLATLYNLGLRDEAFELIDRSSFAYMFDAEQGWPHGSLHGSYIFNVSANRGMIADPRFPRLCAKMGLCDYWQASGRWPDCADQVAYDFRSEARRLL
jgi:adenylate cyclase